MRVQIDARGVDRTADELRRMARRAGDLRPLGYKVRDRWLESENRVFHQRLRWTRRAPSTMRRYRYPVRRWREGGKGPMRRWKGGLVGEFTGTMRKSLTHAHSPGVKDSIFAPRGQLVLNVGVQGKGPLAHANLFHAGAGSRPPRPVVVFDTLAARDSARDTNDYLLARQRRGIR
ncbi:MAG: hypothetical protein QM679_02915 [Patulibacter sp.]